MGKGTFTLREMESLCKKTKWFEPPPEVILTSPRVYETWANALIKILQKENRALKKEIKLLKLK